MLRRRWIEVLDGAYAISRDDIRDELNAGLFSVGVRIADQPTVHLGTLLFVGEASYYSSISVCS